MKRTTSTLAALGLALSGTAALAGVYIPPGGRVERQPATDQRHDGRRDDRRDDRRDERRDDRRVDRRADHSPPPPRHVSPRDPGPHRGSAPGWRDDRGRQWRYSRDWYDHYRADRWRFDQGRWYARDRYSIGIYVFPRGYSLRSWQRGQWLPGAYYAERRWHLAEYWRFALYDPPYAAGWVRVGDDALLVDLRSGEVLDVVYRMFW